MRAMSLRTAASTMRTAVYGGVAGIFAISEAEAIAMVDSILIGGMMADYVTWFFRSILTLSGNILQGCYEGIVNILFGWFVFHVMDIQVKPDEESIALASLAFILVAGLKIGCYHATSLVRTIEDGE